MANKAGHLEAVHTGHFNIQQDDVRFVILKLGHGIQTIFGGYHFHAVAFQQA